MTCPVPTSPLRSDHALQALTTLRSFRSVKLTSLNRDVICNF